MKRNDRTTRTIFIFDTPSLLELEQAGAHGETSKRIKALMLRFESECLNEYGFIARRSSPHDGSDKTTDRCRPIHPNCVGSETRIVCAVPSSTEIRVTTWMRLVLPGYETGCLKLIQPAPARARPRCRSRVDFAARIDRGGAVEPEALRRRPPDHSAAAPAGRRRRPSDHPSLRGALPCGSCPGSAQNRRSQIALGPVRQLSFPGFKQAAFHPQRAQRLPGFDSPVSIRT